MIPQYSAHGQYIGLHGIIQWLSGEFPVHFINSSSEPCFSCFSSGSRAGWGGSPVAKWTTHCKWCFKGPLNLLDVFGWRWIHRKGCVEWWETSCTAREQSWPHSLWCTFALTMIQKQFLPDFERSNSSMVWEKMRSLEIARHLAFPQTRDKV